MPRRKKTPLKLIEDFMARKACYKKRQGSLLKKVEDLSTLCDMDACAIIFGPGDNVPIVWPSHDKAKEMVDRFENAPLTNRLRKNANPQVHIQKTNKKLENQLVKLKQKNDEKDMSNFMHKIHDDGKSLSDFDASDICRLLCYVEGKLKDVRAKVGLSEQRFSLKPPTPQVSYPLQKDTNSSINIDEQVIQQPFFDEYKEASQKNNGLDNNIISNMELPPLPPQIHVDDANMVLPQVNFEGFNLGDVDMVFPPKNFGGLINKSGLGFGMLPQGDFIGINGNSDLGPLYGSSFGEIGGNDIWPSYENFGGTISGSDMMLPFNNNFEGNINETFIGIGQHDENQGGSSNNKGLCDHQITFGTNNDEATLGGSNSNFVGTIDRGNLNLGFPSHANLASTGEGSDIE